MILELRFLLSSAEDPFSRWSACENVMLMTRRHIIITIGQHVVSNTTLCLHFFFSSLVVYSGVESKIKKKAAACCSYLHEKGEHRRQHKRLVNWSTP